VAVQEILVNNSKARLYGCIDMPSRSFNDILLFSHGLLSGVKESQRYAILKTCLHKHCVATAGFYFPAHGPRKDERFSLDECVATLERAIEYITSIFPDKRLTVAGVSLGSTIISLLSKPHQKSLKGAVLFSIAIDLAQFLSYRFEQRHYDRWQSYGYSVERAQEMFTILATEGRETSIKSKVIASLLGYEPPKLLIHGLNDTVTKVGDVTAILDQNSTLLVYSGAEATHDIKGVSLACACDYTAGWVKSLSSTKLAR